jgi:hypothetical protein
LSIPPQLQLQLEQLLIKQTLHELTARFSRAADRLDASAMEALFHPDAHIDSGVLRGPPAYFAPEFVRWVRRNARVVFHSVSSGVFEIEGTKASGESYVMAISRLNATPESSGADSDVLTVGRYMDRFEQRAGQWKFTQKCFVLDYSISQPAR